MATQSTDAFSSAPAAVKVGRWFFKKRDFTPVPIVIFAAFLAMPTPATLIAGMVMMLVGDSVRLWGISYIGGASRTRSDGVTRLIRSGPFGRMRNPLYVGNFIMSTGAVVMTGMWWFLPIFLILFAVQYQCIVLYEEFNIRRTFGEAYDEYRRQVPRWLPLGPGGVDKENPITPNFRAALRSERNSLVAMVCTAGIFTGKYLLLPNQTVWAFLTNALKGLFGG